MLGMRLPEFSWTQSRSLSVMPAQAGIQCLRTLLDSRFCGKDEPAPCEYLGSVRVNIEIVIKKAKPLINK